MEEETTKELEDSTLRILKEKSKETSEREFDDFFEESIIFIAIEFPELFTTAGKFIKPELFESLPAKYVLAVIMNLLEKHGVVPSRNMLKSHIFKEIDEDEELADEIIRILDHKVEARDVPVIKDQLVEWARKRAYSELYSEEAMLAYHNNDFQKIHEIVEKASMISDVEVKGMWFLESFEVLLEEEILDTRTTGFSCLDGAINQNVNGGGMCSGETLIFIAGTGVGKTIALCNVAANAIKQVLDNGKVGEDVLLVTFELDWAKTATRVLGSLVGDTQTKDFSKTKDHVRSKINTLKNSVDSKLFVAEMPPDSCSADDVEKLMEDLRKKNNFHPKYVILDYLGLMLPRSCHKYDKEYQKHACVSNDLRRLAKKTSTMVITAAQTNRGDEEGVAGLNRVAGSYDATFSSDYVVSINQTLSERNSMPPRIRMFMAKNRNGPKGVTFTSEINYGTMSIKEIGATFDE